MSDAKSTPIRFNPMFGEGLISKYNRDTWEGAGVDQFTQPPAQHQDMCMQLVNVMPPMSRVINRRYGYRTFYPKLDQGIGTGVTGGGGGGTGGGGDQIGSAILFGVGFNGSTGYASTAKSTTFNYNPTLSVELYFETSSVTGGYLVSFDSLQTPTAGETTYFGIYMNPAGNIGAGFYNGTSVQLTATTASAYNNGTPHQLVFTIIGGTAKIYIDNVLQVTSTLTTGSGTPSGYWRLGHGTGGAGWPSGITYTQAFVSHVAIWSSALSTTQINNHFQAIMSVTGAQPTLEGSISADAPLYFWYLTESVVSTPPPLGPVVQTAKATFANTLSNQVNFSLPVTVGNTILLCIGEWAAAAPSVSDNLGHTYTLIQSYPKAWSRGFWVYYTTVATAGSLTITMTTGHQAASQVLAQELRGVFNTGNPVDGSAVTSHYNTTTVALPVTTTNTNDRVYSIIYTGKDTGLVGPTVTLNSTGGFGLQDSYRDAHGFIGIAYTTAPAAGTFTCNWSFAQNTIYIEVVFGLRLTTIAGNTGTTAFDYADSNNGTYAASGSYTTNTGSTNSITGTNPINLTVTTGTSGINVGDGGFLLVVLDPTGATNGISSITDSNGNTWAALSASQTFTNGGARTSYAQVWTTTALTAVAPSTSTYTISVTPVNGWQAAALSFVNVPALQILDQQRTATGTSANPASGGITIAQSDFLLSFVAASKSISSVTGPFAIASGTTQNLTNIAASIATAYIAPGTATDTWTLGSSGNWADFLIAFKQVAGYSLGLSVIA